MWNWGLRRWKDHHAATGKSIGYIQLAKELAVLKKKPETWWLNDMIGHSLQQALKDLERAFKDFFAGRARYPRFKSKKSDPLRFRVPSHVAVLINRVYLPKLGPIRFFASDFIDDLKIKSATIRRAATGKWFVTILTEFEIPDVALPPADPAKVVGVDLGLKAFATLSDGSEPIPAPRFYREGQRKLRHAQRALSRRKIGSRRREKARLRVAKIHQKVVNQRGDFLHKLSNDMVKSNDGICIEDLSLKGLVRTKLAKSFSDASMGEFRRQLEYKSVWNRKHLAVVDRWFPSSKMCNACKAINAELTLKDRTWTCVCGGYHDRDINAARNIRDEGLRLLAAGHADKSNARGRNVRLPKGSNSD